MEGTRACAFDNAELTTLARGKKFSSLHFELIFPDEKAISFVEFDIVVEVQKKNRKFGSNCFDGYFYENINE